MISISFFARLVTLPFVLVWTSVLYITIGTRFRDQESFRKSYLLNLIVLAYAHLSSGMTLNDCKYLDGRKSLFGLLQQKEKKINPFNNIPNYGKVFTRKDAERKTPDSAWLVKQPGGQDKEETVIVHLHGGMLCHPYSPIFMFTFSNLYTLLQKQGLNPSMLLVDYTLLPEGGLYPTPIIECLNVYDNLVSLGYKKILLVGDSAGGYLILSLLYHLNERSKTSNVVWPCGVTLISPWLDLNKAKKIKSYKSNATKDVINFDILQKFGKEFFLRNEESYSLPLANINLNTSDDIWSELPPLKEGNFLILIGENEILRDSILEWCLEKSSLGKKYPERIMIEPNGVHDGVFLTETFMFYMQYMTFEEWSQKHGVTALYNFTKEILEKN